MKKLLLFIGAIFLLSVIFAQNPITTFPWTEGFEGETFPPESWTHYQVSGQTSWERTTYAWQVHNGLGAAFHIYGTSNTLEDTWLVTPEIQLPNSGNYVLKFYAMNGNWSDSDNYSGDVFISTASNDPSSGDFILVKQGILSYNWEEIVIALNKYLGENIFIAFRFTSQLDIESVGRTWMIDDIIIDELPDCDAELLSIIAPFAGTNVDLTSAELVTVIVKNNGANSLNGFQLKLELNNVVITTETFTESIPSFGQSEYTFTATIDLSADGDYVIKVTVMAENDQVPDNNSKTIMVTNIVCRTVSTNNVTEGFEDETFPPLCWLNFHISGIGNWRRTIDFMGEEPHTGLGAAIHTSFFMGTDESWLVTPTISLAGSSNAMLRFYTKIGGSGANPGSDILISTSSNDPSAEGYVIVKQLTEEEQTEEWQEVSISLDDYLGEDIFIAFRYIGTAAKQWYIDDITIENVVGINAIEPLNFTLYPNPAKDLLKIILPAVGKAQVEIYNSMGALIHAFENREPEFEINLSGYSAGVYFIRLQDGKSSATQTFVKQ